MTDASSPMDPPQVLVADDQADVLDALRLLLQGEGLAIEAVQSPAGVLGALDRREFDLLLMDLNYARDTTSGREGLDLLSRIRASDAQLPVVVMTGWGTMEIAIEALRNGVCDFVQKPWDNDHLVDLVQRLATKRRDDRHAAAKRRRELREARDIQQRLLPAALPRRPGWDLAAACEAAASVGGDTYDVIEADPTHLAVTIADVAGKGIPAALLAASVQAAVRSAVAAGLGPSDVCARVNRDLRAVLPDDRFVTFFIGLLDTTRAVLRYTNAGHNPPLVLGADGHCARLSGGGMVLGLDADTRYEERRVALARGDVLVLYTDGITEAADGASEEFGEARLAARCAADRGGGAGDMRDRLLAEVQVFSDGRRDDDQTVVIVCRDGPA
jgi:sigma-B regulation protein RsbU (phosphoserine phosphatase)